MGEAAAGPSRRDRQRDATTAEIKRTARELLVRDGEQALSLRAIAREMGMTAPGLYRYFGSHEDLVTAVVADLLAELTVDVSAARDAVPVTDPVERLLAACRAFRRWSLAHPREFQLTFASPAPRLHHPPVEGSHPAEWLSFGGVFLGIFVEMWNKEPFAIPRDNELDPALAAQLRSFSAAVGDVLPLGALAGYLSGWVRLYGSVTIEVFGHLGFALADPEALFEQMLADMSAQLSAPLRPGRARARGEGPRATALP